MRLFQLGRGQAHDVGQVLLRSQTENARSGQGVPFECEKTGRSGLTPILETGRGKTKKGTKPAVDDGCQLDGLDTSAASTGKHPTRCNREILANLQLGTTLRRLGEP